MADDNFPRAPRYPFARSNAAPESPARGQGNDPLSELARLIGQSDPFAEPVSAPPPSPPSQRTLREILAGARESHTPDTRESYARDMRWRDQGAAPSPADHNPPPLVPDFRSDARDDIFRDDRFRDPIIRDDGRVDALDVLGRQPVPPEVGPLLPPHDGYADDSREPAPPFEGMRPEDANHAYPEYGQRHADGPYYGDDGQLLPGDAHAQMQPDDSESLAPPRRRGGLVIVAAVLGLAVLGTAGAYAYRTFFSGAPGFPPLIRADGGPHKIVPAPGEATLSKQIYDRLGGDGAQGEKVVSREEQPVDVRPAGARSVYPGAPSPSNSATPSSVSQPRWPAAPGSPAATPPAAGARNQDTPGNLNEPRKVRTVPIRSDQQGGTQGAPSQPQSAQAPPTPAAQARTAAVAPEASAQPARSAAPRTPTAAASGGGPLSLNPRTDGEERATPAAPAASPRTIAAAAPRTAAPAAQGGYVVQLSAQRSQDEAVASFRSFQGRYPSILGGQQMLIRRKEVPDKGTFYGAQVGPFGSQAQAVQLCDQLKSAGGNCLVQKN